MHTCCWPQAEKVPLRIFTSFLYCFFTWQPVKKHKTHWDSLSVLVSLRQWLVTCCANGCFKTSKHFYCNCCLVSYSFSLSVPEAFFHTCIHIAGIDILLQTGFDCPTSVKLCESSLCGYLSPQNYVKMWPNDQSTYERVDNLLSNILTDWLTNKLVPKSLTY